MMNYNYQVVNRPSGNTSNHNMQVTPSLFPLPLLQLPPKSSSRRARQRYGEALCATTLLNHSVSALNCMYNSNPTLLPASNMSVGSIVNVSKGQHRLLSHMYNVSKHFVVASKLSARTACQFIRQDRSAVSTGSSVLSDNISDSVPVHSVLMSYLSSECIESILTSTSGVVASTSSPPGMELSKSILSYSSPVSTYFGEDPLLNAIPIVASRVSLPTRLSRVPLTSLLPSELASAYAEVNSSILAPPDLSVHTNSNWGQRKPQFYGERSEYLKLLQRMQKLNMIAFTTKPKAINGLFGVPKDGYEI